MFHRRSLIPVLVLSLAALLGALGGCGGKADGDQILATIGDRVIDVDYYTSRLIKLEQNQLPRGDDGTLLDMSSLEGKRAFLDIIIDKELMVSKALQLGYDGDAGVENALGSLTEYHAMTHFWQDEIGDPSRWVTEEDVDYYYSRLGERRDCHFIIADMKEDALQAIEEARAGASWAEIVAKYHDAPTKNDQEPVIAVAWGQYRDTFEEPIFAVAKGEVTEPIATEHGWWVMRIDEVTMEDKPALETIRGKVVLSISKRHENLRREELLRRVAEERSYTMNEDALLVVFNGLPAEENIVDPVTGKPTPQDALQALDVPTTAYSDVVMSYNLASGPVVMTVADIKSQFDRQNVFERPKKGELLGGLRSKLKAGAERSMMVDESRQRGYFEDKRVERAAFRQVEEMLVDKLHQEVVHYEEYVGMEEIEAFWADHSEQYNKPERRTGQMVRCVDLATAQSAREGIMSGDLTWKAANKRFGNDPGLEQSFGRFNLIGANETGAVRDQLFGLEMDAFSETFEVEGGWAVMQLTKVMPPETPVLQDMSEIVAQRIRNRRMDAALRTLLGQWNEEFPVEVDEKLLGEMPSWGEAIKAASEKADAAAMGKG